MRGRGEREKLLGKQVVGDLEVAPVVHFAVVAREGEALGVRELDADAHLR